MGKHQVTAELRNVELVRAKSSLRLRLHADGQTIGELEVGSGSLYWFGRGRQKPKRINWTKFAAMMDKLAYGDKE